jgi:dipeptidyl aminopeptidase/acylaminoacyl peptidase
MTNADPAIRERLKRAANRVPLNLESRLDAAMTSTDQRNAASRSATIVVAAAIAVVAVVAGWLAIPRGRVDSPGSSLAEPGGVLITLSDGTHAWPPLLSITPADGTAPPIAASLPGDDLASDWDWAPDLSHVAWIRSVAEGQPDQLLVISDPDGSHAIKLAALSGFSAYRGRAWSADGTRFAYAVAGDEGTELRVFDLVANEETTIARWQDSSHVGVDWSPDASRLAVAVPEGADPGVFTLDANGEHRLRVSDLFAWQVGWSPTSEELVVEAPGPGEALDGIWLMAADGSDAHRLTPTDGLDLGPVWSPDGAWIAFSRDISPGEPKDQPQTGTTVFVMRPDGSDVRQVLPVAETGWNEVWDWLPALPPAR